MVNRRIIDADITNRANGKVPVWSAGDGTHDYLDPALIGSGIAESLLDAKGDMIAASAADTAAKVTVGANGTRLEAASGATAGVQWSYPPGYEFDHVQATSGTAPNATSEATANTVITGNAIAYDGSTIIIIEFFAFSARADVGAIGRTMAFYLYDDTGSGAASIGRLGLLSTPAAAADNKPVLLRRRLTPSAATHTYSIRAAVSAGTGSIGAGAGGSGADVPMYIRQIKV